MASYLLLKVVYRALKNLRILNFLEKFRILSIKLDKHEIIEFKKRSLIILFLGTFGGVSMLCFNIYFNFNRRIFVARVKSSSGHLGEFCGHYDKNLNHVIVLSILESLLLENDLGKYSRIEYKNMIEGAKYVCLENLDSSRSFVINKAGGFFHFYLEVMPILLRNRDKNFSIHFIIEDKPFYQSILNFYQLKYVNTAVDNFDSIETLESSKYYPSFEEIKWFRNFNSIFAKDKSVSKRIYISRKNESARRISNEIEISNNNYYLSEFKDIKLTKPLIEYKIVELINTFEVSLTSKNLVKNVFVDIASSQNFSDNYFDMIPGKEYKISINKEESLTLDDIKRKINFLSLFDTH